MDLEYKHSILDSLNINFDDQRKKSSVNRSLAALVDNGGPERISSADSVSKTYQKEKHLRQLLIFDKKKDGETQAVNDFNIINTLNNHN